MQLNLVVYIECYMAYNKINIMGWSLLSAQILPGCLAFPVTLTVLAIQRVFGHHEHLCPFWMHHALCNWPRLHGGSAGPLPELLISETQPGDLLNR